jgi:hypothetical protein
LPSQATVQLIQNKKLTLSCAIGGSFEVSLRANIKPLPLASLSGSGSFGEVDISKNGLSKTFTLTNSNGSVITLSSPILTGSSDYTINSSTCGTTLADGASCTYSIKLNPTSLGSKVGTLSVGIADATSSGSLGTNLSGTGTQISLTLTPNTISFKDMEFGTADFEVKTLTLTNNGTRSAKLTYNTLNSPYTNTSSCGAGLAAGASCTMDIKCTAATTAGDQNQTLTATDTLNGETTAVSSALTCRTLNVAKLAIKDDRVQTTYTNSNIALTDITGAVNTANNIVDLSPASRTVTFSVKNDSVAPAFTIKSVTVSLLKNSGPTADPTEHIIASTNTTCGVGDKSELDPGEECTIEVKYTPTAVRETNSNFTLTTAGNINGQAASIKTLEIRGRSYKGATLSSDVADNNFGVIASNTSATSSQYNLSNSGDIKATNLSFDLSGSNFSKLLVDSSNCGTELLGNSSCTFNVGFQPAGSAVAINNTLNITSIQQNLMSLANFKGTSYSDDQGVTIESVDDGYEPELQSDENNFYIASKLVDGTGLKLQICPKNSATGNISSITSASCGESSLIVPGENYFSGFTSGYKINLTLSQNKILFALSNQKGSNSNKGASTLVVCNKSAVTASRTLDMNSNCSRFNVHDPSINTSVAGGTNYDDWGAFTSMAVNSNKVIIASQRPSGFSITACSFSDTSLNPSSISSCKSYFNTSLGNNQAEYTDVAFDGNNIIFAAHRPSSGLWGLACSIDSTNLPTCGTYQQIDNNTLTVSSIAMYSGAFPNISLQASDIFITHQQGKENSKALRLSKCSLTGFTFSCSNKQVAVGTGNEGVGFTPHLQVISRGTSKIGWIATSRVTDFTVDWSLSEKSLALYSCDLTNFSTSCSAYLPSGSSSLQTTFTPVLIYSRKMELDSSKKTLTIPFTERDSNKLGIFSIGLSPEL